MTTSTDIEVLIARTQVLLLLLDTLIASGRPQAAQRVLYEAARYYLQVLLIDLTNTRDWLKAVENIQSVIGNQEFTGINAEGEQYSLERVQAIDDALQICQLQDLACLVATAAAYPEVSTALKVRIIEAVRLRLAATLVDFDYDGRDESGNALPLMLLDISFPWDNPLITAQNLFNQIPFQYNRIEAATYAIQTSRDNFEGSYFPYDSATIATNGNVEQIVPTPPFEVGAGLIYNTLAHRRDQQSTGSAYFISEALFFGGHLPMYAQDGDEFDCGDPLSLNPPLSSNNGQPLGWLTCCAVSGSNLNATDAWRSHPRLVAYFVSTHDVSPIDGEACDDVSLQVCDNPNLDTVGYQDNGVPQTLLDSYMRFNPGLNNMGYWREGHEIDGPQYLYKLFRKGRLAKLETGDYVYIGEHGFLIVGWGEAVDGPLRLNAIEEIEFNLTRPRDALTHLPLDTIPYIADFAYGYDSVSARIGWLQDVRPRPFYTSHVLFSDNQLLQQRQRLSSNTFDVSQETDFQSQYLDRFQNRSYYPFSQGDVFSRVNWSFLALPNIIRIPFSEIYQGTSTC